MVGRRRRVPGGHGVRHGCRQRSGRRPCGHGGRGDLRRGVRHRRGGPPGRHGRGRRPHRRPGQRCRCGLPIGIVTGDPVGAVGAGIERERTQRPGGILEQGARAWAGQCSAGASSAEAVDGVFQVGWCRRPACRDSQPPDVPPEHGISSEEVGDAPLTSAARRVPTASPRKVDGICSASVCSAMVYDVKTTPQTSAWTRR
jgi:hypothetical protein